MAETKPSGRSIVEGDAAIVTQEVAHVDAKGVLNILPRWTTRLSWLTQSDDGTDALMLFLEPGRISIRDIGSAGRITERYGELVSNPTPETLDLLRLIQDRYGRLYIPKSKRVSVGEPALLHLGIQRGVKTPIYVAIFPTSLELLSVAYRNAQLLEFRADLEDLPFTESY
jgi:hypothetical protein